MRSVFLFVFSVQVSYASQVSLMTAARVKKALFGIMLTPAVIFVDYAGYRTQLLVAGGCFGLLLGIRQAWLQYKKQDQDVL